MKNDLIKIGMIEFGTMGKAHTHTAKELPFFFDICTPSIRRFEAPNAVGKALEVPQ